MVVLAANSMDVDYSNPKLDNKYKYNIYYIRFNLTQYALY